MKIVRFPFMIFFSLFLVIITSQPLPAEEFPKPIVEQAGDSSNELAKEVSIDFDDVDIHLLIKFISELTGKNFVIDKSVQGKVTIISPTKISVTEAYKVFESVLEVNGFTTVQSGRIIKIMPAARARSQNIQTINNGMPTDPLDRIVTQVVPLKYSSPETLKKILTPLVSQTSVLVADDRSGLLIITETLSNIQKLLKIIKLLDIEAPDEDLAVITLENASCVSLAKIIQTIYQPNANRRAADGALSSGDVKIAPYERANALVVIAKEPQMARIKKLISMLDKKVERNEGNIHVYYLQNATAAEMVKVLSTIPQQTTKGSGENSAPQAATISNDAKILADPETNSLIVIASKDDYVFLEDVIRKLDIPRRMVYLEALIMEVDADKTFEVGAQWAAAGTFSDNTGELVSGFSGANGYDLLPGLSADDPDLPAGYSLGLIKQGIQIGDVVFPNIAAILKAYRTDTDINIISTPQILTTDNKKAEISVGENVPYITSRNTTATEQDYTNYEYKDVATKLSIVPHINQAETLSLEIQTEVVRIKGSASDTPTTYKRTAATAVILRDNDTVVIGGIMGKDATNVEWKIPLLGDIPFLGWLFKTHTTTNTKTNMFIFITPHIVRNPAEAATVTVKKQKTIQKEMGSEATELDNTEEEDLHQDLLSSGYAHLKAGRYADAKLFFSKILQQNPLDPEAMFYIAYIFEQEKMIADALEMYRGVVDSGTDLVNNDPLFGSKGQTFTKIAQTRIALIQRNQGNEQ